MTMPPKARPLDCPTCGGTVDRRSWRHRRHARGPRPYPIELLAVAMGLDSDAHDFRSRLAVSLGLEASVVRRGLQDGGGLTAKTADHWAARAGLHADIVWPGWWDDPTETDALPGEDDPPLDEVDPITDERRVWLVMDYELRRRTAA